MYQFLKKAHIPHSPLLSYYSNLLDYCFSSKCLSFARITHAPLIKIGFNRHTFLGNRCVNLYSHVGVFEDFLKVFEDIATKNCISWNICLKGLFRFGRIDCASKMFDEMPERDVVSWNTMISGYSSSGFVDRALEVFVKMKNTGERPSAYTYSIILSLVSCAWHGKEIHCNMIRHDMCSSNVVLGNSLIDMYGKLGLLDYAFSVFFTMELDIISWNSLIMGCYESGFGELALNQFDLMRFEGNLPDHYTISTVIAICSNLRNLEKDWMIQYDSLEKLKGGTRLSAIP